MSAPVDAGSMPRRASTWADYYRRRRVVACTLLLGPFAMLAAHAWIDLTHPIVLVVAWILAIVVSALYLQAFICPRCDGRFFPRTPLLGLRARRCHRCMVSKY